MKQYYVQKVDKLEVFGSIARSSGRFEIVTIECAGPVPMSLLEDWRELTEVIKLAMEDEEIPLEKVVADDACGAVRTETHVLAELSAWQWEDYSVGIPLHWEIEVEWIKEVVYES